MDSKCIICNKELKSRFLTLTDGKCCKECWTSAGIEDVPYIHADSRIYSSYDLQRFSELRKQDIALRDNFHPTKSIYYHTGGIEFDDGSMTFRITQFGHSRKKSQLFHYKQIHSHQIDEKKNLSTSISLGRAALGEMLLGENGGILGALSNVGTYSHCYSMILELTLCDCPLHSLNIVFLNEKTSIGSSTYRNAHASAKAIEKQLTLCKVLQREANHKQRVEEYKESQARHKQLIQELDEYIKGIEERRAQRQKETEELEREMAEFEKKMEEHRKRKLAQNNGSDISDRKKTNTSVLSAAEEIRQYKQLFNDGIITEEEFQAKKKQLLGL